MPNGENDAGTSPEIEALRQEASQQSIAELKSALDSLVAQAAEVESAVVRNSGNLRGTTGETGTDKGKAEQVKKSVQKIVLAITQDATASSGQEVAGVVSEFAENVIQKIAQKIPVAQMTDSSSPYVYRIVQKVINGDISNVEDLKQEFDTLGGLQAFSHGVFEPIQEAFIEFAQEHGYRPEQAQEMFGEEPHGEASQETPRSRERQPQGVGPMETLGREEADFDQTWRTYYSAYINEEERPLVEAVYVPEKFKAEVIDKAWSEAEQEYRQETPDRAAGKLTQEEIEVISKEMSRKISLRFTRMVSKIFRTLDVNEPEKDFSEIISQGSWASPQQAFNLLRQKISQAPDQLTRLHGASIMQMQGADGETYDMKFWKRHVEGKKVERLHIWRDKDEVEQRDNVIVNKNKYSLTEANINEFMVAITNGLGAEIKWREVTHNIGVIFSRSNVGEAGFWNGVAGYVDQIGSTDLDSLSVLPDSDLVNQAYRLYLRYSEGEFANHNWVHQPDMYSKKMDRWGAMQEKVIKQLKKLRQFEGEDEWRVHRAMSIATGLARGVFLSEVEMAAFADPHLTPEGDITFNRMYLNDNIAIQSLNPMHHIYRFKLTATRHYPPLYLPVSETHPDRIWDHNKMWDLGQKFRDSFLKGSQDLKEKGREDEKSIMELLPNFSHGAGLFSRPGWRLTPAYSQWMVTKPDKETGRETNAVDFLETWKSLENIGYQVLYNHVINTVEDAGGLSRENNPEFYKYIYEKYIDPESKMGGLDAEVERLRPTAEKTIKGFVKKGISYPFERKKLIENEISRIILYKSLAGVLRQRMPTKFLLLERNRFVKDGERPWQKILTEMENETGDYKVKNVEEYNELIDHLILVENQIRDEVTQQMDEHLKIKTNDDFANLSLTDKYQVDGPTIRRILANQIPVDQINKVVRLHEKIIEHHGSDKSLEEWGDKIRWVDGRGKWIKARDFAFSIASEETELKYLSFINVGEKMLHNTLSEVGLGEAAFKGLQEWIDSLRIVASDGKRDFGPIIEAMNKVKGPISNIENSDYATKWAYYMAQASVAFFRKDSLAKAFPFNFVKANLGDVTSMAGEVVGARRGAWEWDTFDQHAFYFALEASGVLPKTAQTFKDPKQYVTDPETGKKYRSRHTSYTSDLARKMSGSTGKEITFEVINKFVPLIIAVMLALYISKALKEASGQKES